MLSAGLILFLTIITKTQVLPLTGMASETWPGLGLPDPEFNISLSAGLIRIMTDTRILGPDSDPPEGVGGIDTSKVYRYIWQTAKYQTNVPPRVLSRIKKFAPNYTYQFHDDILAEKFLSSNFDKKVVEKYRSFKVGAHKADLWRYCVLYKMGGVYMDIETVLMRSIDEILADASTQVSYTVDSAVPDTVMQGFIATPPNSPFFKKCIEDVMNTPEEEIDKDYLLHTRKFFKRLSTLVRTYPKVGELWVPKKVTGEGKLREKWVLFEENCERKDYRACGYQSDVYNNCCVIQDKFKRPMMFTRYPDFPWGGGGGRNSWRWRQGGREGSAVRIDSGGGDGMERVVDGSGWVGA
ncbi:hypothetical protein TL16_g09165 [Triparma laevis f. inornata]|uniref:Glycosyltransferase family 32 protein n=1 Tax=Triparma laevis f. inornata TaxID=1714386 RepID=A0A9W7B997_9STRA|nr:hypothetical protein TL16_g09165 [Triparma laevis f. inornata]